MESGTAIQAVGRITCVSLRIPSTMTTRPAYQPIGHMSILLSTKFSVISHHTQASMTMAFHVLFVAQLIAAA